VKTLRKQCAGLILTLTMAVSAYAGILQTPGCVGVGTGGTDNTTTQLMDVTTTIIVTIITTVP